MKRMIKAGLCFLLLLAAVVVPGCGTAVTFSYTNKPPAPLRAKTPDKVEVLSLGPPQRPFAEVGMLEAQQESAYSADSQGEIIQKMREQAAEVGCDAIVITGESNRTGYLFLGGANAATTLKGLRAACIVYTGDKPSP